MRFFLDNDVDVAVRGWLQARHHEVWTAAQAALPDAADDTLSVYADDERAVLITHDEEFTERRKRRCIGRHVRLCCVHPDAVQLIERRFDDSVLEVLRRKPHVTIELHWAEYRVFFGDW